MRGFLARKEVKNGSSAKKSSRKEKKSARNKVVDEPGAPILSHRSNGVLASGRKGSSSNVKESVSNSEQKSGRNELQNAKPIPSLPDYSNKDTREAEA